MGSGVKVGEVYGALRLDKGTFDNDLRAAGGLLTGFNQKFKELIAKPGLFGAAVKTLGTGFGLGGGIAAFNALSRAGHAVFDFLGDSIQKASDLAESQGKVNVVFGESSTEITAWAANASRAFGQSKQQALEAAGTYGNLFQAFGVGQREAAKMSTTLVELAADLASFNNTSVDDALIALRAGLSGEVEPLRRYGIAVSDARMRTELLAQGYKDLGATLTPLQKSQAAYAIIMHDSALAQGDFKRTADGLANTQRANTALWADLQAEIGEMLLPAMIELGHVVRDVIIPGLRGAVPVIAHFLGLAVKLGAVAVPILAVALGVKLVGALKAVELSAKGALGPLGLIIIAGEQLSNAQMSGAAAALEAGIRAKEGAAAAKVFSDAYEKAGGDVQAAMDALNEYLSTNTVTAGMKAESSRWAGIAAAELAKGAAKVRDGAQKGLVAPTEQAMRDARKAARDEARAIPGDISRALVQGMNDIETGLDALKDLMENSLSDAAKIARLKGILASKELAAGLRDERADVRGAAMQLQQDTLEQLNLIESGAADAAVDTGTTFAYQLGQQSDAASRAAADVARAAIHALETTGDPGAAGGAIIQAWVDGMRLQLDAQYRQFVAKVGMYSDILGGSLPKTGPLQHPERGGQSIGETWWAGLVRAIGGRSLNPVLSGVFAGLSMPGMAGPALAGAAAAAGGALGGQNGAVLSVTFGDLHFHDVGSDVSKEAARNHAQEILDIVATGIQEEASRFPNRPGLD